MPLPILKVSHEPSQADLIRFYHRIGLHWARHVGEETAFDFGTAFTNPALSQTPYFNVVLDALVPEGQSAEQAMERADEHFAAAGARCRRWVLAPGAAESQTRPLADMLLSRGFSTSSFDILHLSHQPTSPISEVPGLTIIPARASYRHARLLAQEWAGESRMPELAEAFMLQLDGDHTDSLIAIKDNAPAAFVCVLAVGDLGGIQDLFVSARFRGQGIGRTMMSRAMEICARSLFKHVFTGADPGNPAPGWIQTLYGRFGFARIGQYTSYTRP